MQTQPAEAVGSEAPVPAADAAKNPFEAIADEMLGTQDEEEEQPVEEAEPEGDEPEAEVDEVTEDDLDDEPDLPAIDAPVSWDAEAKEAFKNLPRDLQETVQKREAERERFVQSKAQEAAQAKQSAQLEALTVAEQIKAQAVEQLQRYAKMFEVAPPSAELFRQNPEAYAQQLEAYQYSVAQGQQAQRDIETAKAEQAQIQEAQRTHEAEMFHQRLAAEMPELLDPSTGQQLAKELNATAELLGFDPNQITDVDAIKALKATSEWKAKADKYDSLMKRKMERVRAGKAPPPIAKPGTARLPDQTRKARADAAWEQVKSAKSRNVRDDAAATWMENSGWL